MNSAPVVVVTYSVVFSILFITCVSIVIVLRSLYMAAVRVLFSLVVLLIKLCEVACCSIVCFEQIKTEERKEGRPTTDHLT